MPRNAKRKHKNYWTFGVSGNISFSELMYAYQKCCHGTVEPTVVRIPHAIWFRIFHDERGSFRQLGNAKVILTTGGPINEVIIGNEDPRYANIHKYNCIITQDA